MGDENKEEITPRSADFSGETQRYPMDGNSNCTAWCRWETYRVYRDGQPGWDCRFIINATKTNTYPTYGQGRVQAGVKGHEEGTLEEKYIEIVAGETRTFYDQAVFVRAEAGADVNMIAYANILIPNVVIKGMEFTITAKRNLWGVYFDANGGSGAPDMIKRHWGEIVYIPTTVPYKSGYTFKGWTKSKGSATVDYKPGDPIGDDFDVTLYAVWSQNVVKTWSITYNANGGSNAPAKQTANVGQSITITYSKPTRTGYTFLGWSTWNESPQPEEAFTPGYSYRSDYDITLYAVWKQQTQTTQYSLSFNLQGGNGTFNTLYGNYGDRVQIPYNSPTRSGYSFLGWATSAYGSASYQPGEYFTLYQNSTLYAVWEKNQTNQYIVSFDLQGGTATGGIPDVIGSYGFTFSITMRKPYKSGYTFQGWATSANGQAVYQPGDSYTIYGNATLYAVWGSQGGGSGDYKLEFDLQGGTGSFPAMYGNKGATLVIPRTTPTKGSTTFFGWAEQPGGQAIYNPGDFYTIQNDTILYAIWDNMSMDNWTITYDANGGTGAPSRQTAYMWTEIVITSKKPTRDGYQFLGWSLYRNATEAEYQPGQSISGWYDMILYAVWEEDSSRMYLGYDSIGKIYIGNRQVTAAYIGTTKIW